MKRISISLIWLCLALSVRAQSTVSGFIYKDLNHSGKKERKEKGIAAVAVTNGEEVVLTDKKGFYQLPISNDQIISVIKPTGYQVPLNTENLPQYFYIHKPNGSPELKYKGVAPTGPLPKRVDFGLFPQKESNDFTALIFGDPQVYSEEQVEYLSKSIIDELKGVKNIAFGISMGDEVGDKLNLFAPYTAAMAKIGVPWYNVMGNHDYNADVKADSLSDESFEAHFGPANYAFNYGNVHMIVLDDVLFPDPRDGRYYYGGLRDDQMEFVANDLKFVPKDYLVVLNFHIPISEPEFLFRSADRIKLFSLLKDFPYTLSISGHTHMQRQDFYEKGEEWLQDTPHHHFNIGTASGDWYSGLLDERGIPLATMRDGTPRGYGFIHFKGNQYSVDYKVAGKPASFQMLIAVPDTINSNETTKFFVNYFMGAEKDEAQYQIDNGDWLPLNYTVDFDPIYVAEVAEWKSITDKTKKARRPSNPAKSKHLWTATLPAGLSTGNHVINVKIKGLYGKTFTEAHSFSVK